MRCCMATRPAANPRRAICRLRISFSICILLAMFGSPVASALISANDSTVSSRSLASRAGEPLVNTWLMNRCLRSTVWNMYASNVPLVTYR